jgi:hypothetical protein
MVESAITTENIINKLENLGVSRNNDEEMNKNQTVCRLLNIQLRNFFDDIYIPYTFFKNDKWNINKTLYDNEDVLFYNKKYLTDTDEINFFQIFDKYISMLEDIFCQDNKLYIFLKKWTDMTSTRWKTNGTKSYLKTLLTNPKYQFISPSYTTNLYCEMCNKYKNNEKYKDHDAYSDIIKKKMEKKMDQISSQIKKEVRIFRRGYNEIVTSYVYEYPYNTDDKKIYTKAFVNCVIMFVLDFIEKLIDLNVYAIHPIVYEIIGYYMPLDEINNYDPSDNDYRRLYIV